jgi:hypothetical protein
MPLREGIKNTGPVTNACGADIEKTAGIDGAAAVRVTVSVCAHSLQRL